MTTRYNFLIVALDENIREDDAQPLIQAIKMLKGVVDVKGNESHPNDWTTLVRVRSELGKKLMDVIYPPEEYSR